MSKKQKSFYGFARSKQREKSKVGPFNKHLLTDIEFGVEDLILATKDMPADSSAGLSNLLRNILKIFVLS